MLKVSEVFKTVQGEGPNVGTITTFVRFGGCNLRCPGWGTATLPDGTEVGACDTPYAVYPEFRSQWAKMSTDDIMDLVKTRHVCITGGEPLLQKHDDLQEFAQKLIMTAHTIDLFTNGTFIIPQWALFSCVTVCMDYKLPKSGEFGKFEWENLKLLSSKDMIKFVVDIDCDADLVALTAALKRMAQHYDMFPDRQPQIYVGPVWDTDTQRLANHLIKRSFPLPVKLNIQTHRYIFPPGIDGTSDRTVKVEVRN